MEGPVLALRNSAPHSLSPFPTPTFDRLPGSNERQRARHHQELREKFREEANKYRDMNDRDNERKFTNKSKSHNERRKKWKEKAASAIFKSNNEGKGFEIIDLHWLHVDEAKQEFKKRIGVCKREGVKKLRATVGKGNNSPGGVAIIKPAIKELAEEMGLKCHIDPSNEGCLIIELPDLQAEEGALADTFGSSAGEGASGELPGVSAQEGALADAFGSSAGEGASGELPGLPAGEGAFAEPPDSSEEETISAEKFEEIFEILKSFLRSGRRRFSSHRKLKKFLLGLGTLVASVGFLWLVKLARKL